MNHYNRLTQSVLEKLLVAIVGHLCQINPKVISDRDFHKFIVRRTITVLIGGQVLSIIPTTVLKNI